MAAPRRGARLAEEVREQVADIVARLKDPRIGFVTVTRAELSGDLSLARVFVGVLGDEEARRKGLEGLRSAGGFVRRELGRRLKLRLTPEVRFEYDKGLDATDRVARLLGEAGKGSEGEPDAEG
jgi:ribosome-binding factor A